MDAKISDLDKKMKSFMGLKKGLEQTKAKANLSTYAEEHGSIF
ncbi:hypothetical protein MIDIC_10066 [Alphaproteobacteria bacterium]